MPNRSMTDRISLTQLASGVKTTELETTGVSTVDASRLELVAHCGAIANIANSPRPSWTFKVQHSDVDSDAQYADCVAADVVKPDGSEATGGVFAVIDDAAEDDALVRAGYVGGKAFARVVATPANTPGNTQIVVLAIKERKLVA